MSTFQDTIPSSVRRPVASSGFKPEMPSRVQRPTLKVQAAARATVLTKSRFAPLPHEPEDAKLTGVTRSLNRRLLALNVNGSLMREKLVQEVRIA